MPQAAVLCYALAASAAVQAWEYSGSGSQCDSLSESLARHSYLQDVYKSALERMGCVSNASQAADGLQQNAVPPRLPHHRALLDTSATGDISWLVPGPVPATRTPKNTPHPSVARKVLVLSPQQGPGPAYLTVYLEHGLDGVPAMLPRTKEPPASLPA